MAVLALFRYRGDPGPVLTSYDKELQHPIAQHQPRRRWHACASSSEGVVIVDLWDSVEDFELMLNDPEFISNLKHAGTPEPNSVEIFDLHATIH